MCTYTTQYTAVRWLWFQVAGASPCLALVSAESSFDLRTPKPCERTPFSGERSEREPFFRASTEDPMNLCQDFLQVWGPLNCLDLQTERVGQLFSLRSKHGSAFAGGNFHFLFWSCKLLADHQDSGGTFPILSRDTSF